MLSVVDETELSLRLRVGRDESCKFTVMTRGIVVGRENSRGFCALLDRGHNASVVRCSCAIGDHEIHVE